MSDLTAPIKVVYVTSRYPAISHSFIQREVVTLRSLGVEIHTVALRAGTPTDVRTAADRFDFARTFAVLPVSPVRLVRTQFEAFFAAPRRYLRAAAIAMRGAIGLTERIRRAGHFVEATIVWRHCRQQGVRHLHAHFERPSADVAMLAAKLGGDRENGWSWSFTAHNPLEYLSPSDGLARKVREAAFVVCVSYFGRSQLLALVEQRYWERLVVVRCGVDTSVFHSRRAPAAEARCILTVGRLVPIKGHAILLEALASLRSQGSDARAVFVGDGPERPRLESLAARLHILDIVEFAGDVGQDRIPERYAEADVFCLASFLEGIPVVLMEAMAMEIPVIASRIGGIPELVDHGVTGRLVTPGSPRELAAALAETLSESPERRAAMGAAGRARVQQEFTCDRSGHALRGLFTAVAADSQRDQTGAVELQCQSDVAQRNATAPPG